jgi:hypothetical protein
MSIAIFWTIVPPACPPSRRKFAPACERLSGRDEPPATGLGWTDGRNLRIDFRSSGGDLSRMQVSAKELVGMQPDIILATSTPTTIALERETRTIPIVFANGSDPVASGIVPRLDRPGGADSNASMRCLVSA